MGSNGDPGKTIRRGCILLLQIFLGLCLSTSPVQGEGKRQSRDILSMGTGLVREENLAAARSAAVGEALNKGFEQYLMGMLGEQGAIRNFPRLVLEMISPERREIESFTILAEERIDRHYKVLVRMRINEQVMAERFREHGIIPGNERPLKVLFLVSQVEQPENRASRWWVTPEDRVPLNSIELVLHQVFEDLGFLPVNRLATAIEGKYELELTLPDLSPDEAFQWGEILSVPVVVQGVCEIIDRKEVRLFLAALGVEKRIVIEQHTRNEVVGEGDEELRKALESAVRSIALIMGPSIRDAVGSDRAATTRIEILVKGLRSFRDLRSVKESIETEVAGVQSVKQTRVAGDSVGLVVDFSGTRDEFLYQIVGRETLPFSKEESLLDDDAIILRVR
jgi:hypothetical protein